MFSKHSPPCLLVTPPIFLACLSPLTPSPCRAATTYYISNDGLYCAEGEARAAEAALAIQKAMPTGGHFNESSGESGTCASRGFTTVFGPDPCTPMVNVSFQGRDGERTYQQNSQAHLKAYAQRYELSTDVASLMTRCTCDPRCTSPPSYSTN